MIKLKLVAALITEAVTLVDLTIITSGSCCLTATSRASADSCGSKIMLHPIALRPSSPYSSNLSAINTLRLAGASAFEAELASSIADDVVLLVMLLVYLASRRLASHAHFKAKAAVFSGVFDDPGSV